MYNKSSTVASRNHTQLNMFIFYNEFDGVTAHPVIIQILIT